MTIRIRSDIKNYSGMLNESTLDSKRFYYDNPAERFAVVNYLLSSDRFNARVQLREVSWYDTGDYIYFSTCFPCYASLFTSTDKNPQQKIQDLILIDLPTHLSQRGYEVRDFPPPHYVCVTPLAPTFKSPHSLSLTSPGNVPLAPTSSGEILPSEDDINPYIKGKLSDLNQNDSVTCLELSVLSELLSSCDSLPPTFNILKENKSITHVKFDQIGKLLSHKHEVFKELLGCLPDTVTRVSLNAAGLGGIAKESPELIAEFFKKLSPSITQIDLCANRLGILSGEELRSFLSLLPKSVTHVNLALNEFYRMPADQLKIAFQGLGSKLISIDLSGNSLVKVVGISKAMGAFPAGLKSVNFSMNAAGNSVSKDQVVAEFSGMLRPLRSVTHIHFSGNELSRLKTDNIIKIMRALPESVTHINLAENALGNMKADDIINIIKAIPNTVKVVNLLNNNWLEGKIDYRGFERILEEMQSHSSIFNVFAPGDTETRILGELSKGRGMGSRKEQLPFNVMALIGLFKGGASFDAISIVDAVSAMSDTERKIIKRFIESYHSLSASTATTPLLNGKKVSEGQITLLDIVEDANKRINRKNEAAASGGITYDRDALTIKALESIGLNIIQGKLITIDSIVKEIGRKIDTEQAQRKR